MGESVSEGTLSSWLKQPGDSISKDDILVEIETDKVAVEVPSPVDGVLSEVLVAEGETVSIGTVIARVSGGEGGAAAPAAAPAASAPAPTASAPAAAPSGGAPVSPSKLAALPTLHAANIAMMKSFIAGGAIARRIGQPQIAAAAWTTSGRTLRLNRKLSAARIVFTQMSAAARSHPTTPLSKCTSTSDQAAE